jgi:hypothetical protein
MPSHQPPEQGERQHIQITLAAERNPGQKWERAQSGWRPPERRGTWRFYRPSCGSATLPLPFGNRRLPGFRREHLNLDLLGRRFSDDRRHVFVHGFFSLLLPRWDTTSNWHRQQGRQVLCRSRVPRARVLHRNKRAIAKQPHADAAPFDVISGKSQRPDPDLEKVLQDREARETRLVADFE